ncbi:transglutaminase family protein [Methanosarcina sp.]|uniref:transglutaminase-like domain-containing protein n=1 Tax=Methanosarcina sp. TaxID=2213 RepID=UPI00298947B2|nr:transglutaminase family protein [Methanosarcina sp.]MDW5551881.1 transglutaminase family protein [Methanosarcina sp.]MDW5554905.1 transglutaminase family protein [Methanosarcina sp.]MDW5559878.1 transglutaminase family protein [Methanosarcina sp.]
MRGSGVSREKKAASTIAILFVFLVFVALTGVLSSDSIENFREEITDYIASGLDPEVQESAFTPQPALFTFPAIPTYSPKKSELTPILRTPLQPGFSLSSNYQTSDFFQGGTGYFRISVKNQGRNPIFIERYGVSVNASESRIYSEERGFLIDPGQEQNFGVIAVEIPEEEKADFSIVLWLLASTSEGKWHDYGPYPLKNFTVNLKPMSEKSSPVYRYNPSPYFETINHLVEPAEPDIRGEAAQVARTYPGAYNIYQVCALFDMVKEKVEYVSDPRGNDIWEPANVTLKIGAGDCEDQAILLSSMLEAVGGTTRVYLTNTHAFAAVYIGNGTDATNAAVEGVRAYYGNVDVNYLTDEYGSWLMLDPTSSLYAGGLPGKTAQAEIKVTGGNETYRSWTFVSTNEVKAIDINPRWPL